MISITIFSMKPRHTRQDVTCKDTLDLASNSSTVRSFSSGPLHIASASIESNGRRLGRLLLIHDMSFIQQRSSDTKWYVFYLFAGLTAVISLVTVLVRTFQLERMGGRGSSHVEGRKAFDSVDT